MTEIRELDLGDLAPVEVPVKIGSKTYVLREASGDAAAKYRNAQLKATKLGPDGKPVQLDGMADADPLLVSLCLFEKVERDGKTGLGAVSLPWVRAMPQRSLKQLVETCKEISGLNDETSVEAIDEQIAVLQEQRAALAMGDRGKNSPSAGTATSA